MIGNEQHWAGTRHLGQPGHIAGDVKFEQPHRGTKKILHCALGAVNIVQRLETTLPTQFFDHLNDASLGKRLGFTGIAEPHVPPHDRIRQAHVHCLFALTTNLATSCDSFVKIRGSEICG